MRRSVTRASALVGGIDPWLMLAFLCLICIGVLMVYSSSIFVAYQEYGSQNYVVTREIVWAILGFAALGITANIDYHRWERFSLVFLAFALLSLAAVLVPHVGTMSNGARRWISLGAGITIEPSEVAKLALILYMASWLTKKGERVRDFQACFVPFSLIVGLAALLIVREPDLGTAIVVATTMIALLFVAGANLFHLVAASVGAGFVAYVLAHSSRYRYDRLTAFIDPWKDASGVGYHTVQALLALGSGGVFGDGLGNSTQKFVLPAAQTDSILAVLGEEWGLMGTVAVLGLFLLLAYRGVRISLNAPDGYGRLLAAGITAWISIQALLNVAVITSSVPFTGVPLPFISYGGTSLIVSMAGIGILLNVSRHTSRGAIAGQSSDNGRGNGGPRLPRAVDHPAPGRRARRAAPASADLQLATPAQQPGLPSG